MLFGASWGDASLCGSRSRASGSPDLRSCVGVGGGGRGARVVLVGCYSVVTGMTLMLAVLVLVLHIRTSCVLSRI